MSAAQAIAQAYPKAGLALAQRIVEVAQAIGAHPYDLANLINFETGGRFSSDVRNSISGATGLIQFMPFIAEELGTTTDALARMSPIEQMSWVQRYFQTGIRARIPKNTTQGLYMSVFYPVAATWPLNKEFSAKVQAWNPGIKTVGDYVAYVNRNARLPSTQAPVSSGGALQAVTLTALDLRTGLLQLPPWAPLLALGAGAAILLILLRRR